MLGNWLRLGLDGLVREGAFMRRTIVFITDFGRSGTGAMAGVVKSVDADLDVYDYVHDIEPYNVREASYELSTVVPFWPAGTYFVVVVDKGVGTDRRSCVARLQNDCFVVTPDNGTLTMVADQILEVRAIDDRRNRLPGSEDVHIFHGRDVFSYTAARLAAGAMAHDEVGPAYPVEDLVRIPLTNVIPACGPGWAEGGIYNFDVPYGTARVNVRNCDFQRVAGFSYGDHYRARVTKGSRVVYEGIGIYVQAFGYADESDAILCGDIQPGESQTLRFNTRGGFLQTHAPELLSNAEDAVDYIVRFERLG